MSVPNASALESRGTWLRKSKLLMISCTLDEKPSSQTSKSALSCCWLARALRSLRVNFEVL
jgi:hypothetical protein